MFDFLQRSKTVEGLVSHAARAKADYFDAINTAQERLRQAEAFVHDEARKELDQLYGLLEHLKDRAGALVEANILEPIAHVNAQDLQRKLSKV